MKSTYHARATWRAIRPRHVLRTTASLVAMCAYFAPETLADGLEMILGLRFDDSAQSNHVVAHGRMPAKDELALLTRVENATSRLRVRHAGGVTSVDRLVQQTGGLLAAAQLRIFACAFRVFLKERTPKMSRAWRHCTLTRTMGAYYTRVWAP